MIPRSQILRNNPFTLIVGLAGAMAFLAGCAAATSPASSQTPDPRQACPLAEVPCCYPTRYQASGVTFPTEGCWEVRAAAAGCKLKFVVYVSP